MPFFTVIVDSPEFNRNCYISLYRSQPLPTVRVQLIRHVHLNTRRINLPTLKPLHIHLYLGHLPQTRLPQRSLTRNLSIHGQTPPLAHGRRLPPLTRLQQLNNRLGSQTLIIIIIQLNHGSIRTRPQTLHLQQRKHPILRRLPILNPQMLLNILLDILAPTNHTGSRSTQLNKVLAHLCAIEHGIKRCHLVDAGGVGLDDFGDFVHGGDGEPSAVLALGEVEEGDDAGLFVVDGVFGEDFVDAFVVFFGEVEVGFWGVVGCVDVKRLSRTHITGLLRGHSRSRWESSCEYSGGGQHGRYR
mmetsp:Transcript_20793/g.37558  ORF Transcript_20793/g.37558 Transcript_20793/m.37558 type:complete len:300 (-) Transcript_20793:15-914(-)